MEIKRFWVVTKPTEVSTLDDIVFSAYLGRKYPNVEAYDLANLFRGGLGFDEVEAIFTLKEEAEELGNKLLEERKARI